MNIGELFSCQIMYSDDVSHKTWTSSYLVNGIILSDILEDEDIWNICY